LDTLENFQPTVIDATPNPVLEPVRVEGKFFFAGQDKLYVKGVTYGPFAPGSHGDQFPERDIVAADFAKMIELGANTVRVFTPPPLWLLDLAAEAGLRVLAGIPWSQHIAFLSDAKTQTQIVRGVAAAIAAIKGHPAIFAYLIGNEIPPDMIRWHGRERIRGFVKRLYDVAKAADPEQSDEQHSSQPDFRIGPRRVESHFCIGIAHDGKRGPDRRWHTIGDGLELGRA